MNRRICIPTILCAGLAALASCGSDDGAGATGEASEQETGDGDPGDGDGEPGDGDGDPGDGDGEPGDGDPGDGDGDDGPKFDITANIDAGTGCEGGGEDADFSYIWIADSSIGAISKLNTQTMIEEGRYLVRPDAAGSPSRTSVNLAGDVAVANRNGGVTKVFANAEDCIESNGVPDLQTSTGANDMLAWGSEECVAWHTPMAYSTQRPLAWSQGTFNPGTCTFEEAKVWTSAAQAGVNGSVVVSVLNGDDGMIEAEIPVPELLVGNFGPYGGAVDGEGNYWFIDSGNDRTGAPLVRVDAEDHSYQIWPTPAAMRPYGFAIDGEGRPWVTGYQWGVTRFDPETETFTSNMDTAALGIMPDADGRMWAATHPSVANGVFALDIETLEQTDWVPLPSSLAWGISIDFYGYVWMVDRGASNAYRIDPDTYQYEVYNDLVGAYTYSDMTGWGLSLVTGPPEG